MSAEFLVLLWIVIVAIVVDGIKVFLEILGTRKPQQSQPSLPIDQVTAVVVAYNESEHIVKTIRSVRKHFHNVIVADDGSIDFTAEIAKAADSGISVFKFSHGGKVRTLQTVMENVTTPYVIFFDADIQLDDGFNCPDINGYTATAFKVEPGDNYLKGKLLQNHLIDTQKYEYAKSMNIGRRFQGATASVHCVSGAAGLFKTERVKKFSEFHSGVFQGEDLERTMLELVADGRVLFCESRVQTDVPITIFSLIKQRLFGWWPGLWRNLPLFLKIMFKKRTPLRLRFEMAYQIVSTITDPLKIASFVYLFLRQEWMVLAFVYLLYLLMEFIVFFRIKSDISLKNSVTTILFFPFYNVFQMFIRGAALLVYLWKRLRGEWRGVRTAITFSFFLLFIPVLARADDEEEKINLTLQPRHEMIKDSNGRSFSGSGLYLGYENFYIDAIRWDNNYERISLGGYFKVDDFSINPELRFRSDDLEATVPKLTVERSLFGPFTGRAALQWVLADEDRILLPRAGIDYYYGDYNFVSVDFYREYGNGEIDNAVMVKNRLALGKNIKFDAGFIIKEGGDAGICAGIAWKTFFVDYSFIENLENYNFDRQTITAGLILKF
mgnify:CR=1 FL=1